MKIVLEHSWQVVVDIDFGDEYATKDHIEFAYNLGTHCSSNDLEHLRDLLRERWDLSEDVDPFNPDDAEACMCDVLLTRRVREAREDESVGLVMAVSRWAEEGWE